jgi:hypothetical protein
MLQVAVPTYAHPVKELNVQVLLHTALLLLLPPRLLLLLLLHSRVHTPMNSGPCIRWSCELPTERLGKRWMKIRI